VGKLVSPYVKLSTSLVCRLVDFYLYTQSIQEAESIAACLALFKPHDWNVYLFTLASTLQIFDFARSQILDVQIELKRHFFSHFFIISIVPQDGYLSCLAIHSQPSPRQSGSVVDLERS
jgi:hypothetical protein